MIIGAPMPPHRALFLDALGTIVRLLPPWDHLDPELTAGLSAERVREAFRAEMRFYKAHAGEGRDAAALATLRERSAEVLAAGLGRPVPVEKMMEAIVFEPFPDAVPALAEARRLGLRTICVSNWDCALPEVLARIGLAGHFDAVLDSATVGAGKPDPRIFEVALERAGCTAAEALHVGDSDEDVEGARAAGIEVLRIDREGGGDIGSLLEIGQHLRA